MKGAAWSLCSIALVVALLAVQASAKNPVFKKSMTGPKARKYN